MPFGLSCTPAIFQRIIEQTVAGVACYLDDIIITGKTKKDHIINLQKTLELLIDSVFHLRKSKCAFLQTSVAYLGHIINKDGIRPQIEMPMPNDQKELRSFLGMINYYDRFLSGLATNCACLNDLLHKDKKWHWTKEHSEAVEMVKETLSSVDTLTHYHPKVPLNIKLNKALCCDLTII